MAFDLPRNTVFAIERLDIRLDPGPHPFERDNGAAIAGNWERERREHPGVFDGTVVLLSELAFRAGVLAGTCHAVRYSSFLYWRRTRRSDAEHAFAHAVMVAADGTLVAIRMGPQTANAGRVYFAAGSFEPSDFPDGQVDLHGNMRREVMEETGLDLGAARMEPQLHALSVPGGTVIFRRYVMPVSAEELAERIRAHVAADPDPEIVGPEIIRPDGPSPDGLMPHMPALIDWHFASPTPGRANGITGGAE